MTGLAKHVERAAPMVNAPSSHPRPVPSQQTHNAKIARLASRERLLSSPLAKKKRIVYAKIALSVMARKLTRPRPAPSLRTPHAQLAPHATLKHNT